MFSGIFEEDSRILFTTISSRNSQPFVSKIQIVTLTMDFTISEEIEGFNGDTTKLTPFIYVIYINIRQDSKGRHESTKEENPKGFHSSIHWCMHSFVPSIHSFIHLSTSHLCLFSQQKSPGPTHPSLTFSVFCWSKRSINVSTPVLLPCDLEDFWGSFSSPTSSEIDHPQLQIAPPISQPGLPDIDRNQLYTQKMDQSCWCAEFKQIPVFHRNTSALAPPLLSPPLILQIPFWDLQGTKFHSLMLRVFNGRCLLVHKNGHQKKGRSFFLCSSVLLASYYTASHEMGPRSSLRISIVSAVGESIQLKHFICSHACITGFLRTENHEMFGFKMVWVPMADFVGKSAKTRMFPMLIGNGHLG